MKHFRLIQLVLPILLLNSCAVLKNKKRDTSKWSVATVIQPKERHHPENNSNNSAEHFSSITFEADSAGQKISVKGDYSDRQNTFLYFHSKTGDQFSVKYDSLHPHTYKIYSNKPWLNKAMTDTTTGKISKVYMNEGYVEYSYQPIIHDSLKKSPAIIHKMQDVRSDSLNHTFFNLKKDSECPVVYTKTDPSRSYLIVGNTIGLIPYQSPVIHTLHRKNTRSASPHKMRSEKGPSPFHLFMSINVLPIESLRVGLNILSFERISAGIDASLLYKNQWAQDGQIYRVHSSTTIRYSQSYFSLDKNVYILNPYIKFYFYREKGLPGAGMYLRAGYSLTTLISGLRSDYYNKQGVPADTVSNVFIHMDPSNNKVLTTTSSFKTTGFTISLGGSFYFDQKHWMMDIGIGYNYMKLPDVVTKNQVVNNETYYHHITPLWRNPINFPLFFQMSMMYKF